MLRESEQEVGGWSGLVRMTKKVELDIAIAGIENPHKIVRGLVFTLVDVVGEASQSVCNRPAIDGEVKELEFAHSFGPCLITLERIPTNASTEMIGKTFSGT